MCTGCMVADSDFEFEFELATRVQTSVRVQTRVWVCVVNYGGQLYWTSPASDSRWPGRGWGPPISYDMVADSDFEFESTSLNSQLQFKHEFEFWVEFKLKSIMNSIVNFINEFELISCCSKKQNDFALYLLNNGEQFTKWNRLVQSPVKQGFL